MKLLMNDLLWKLTNQRWLAAATFPGSQPFLTMAASHCSSTHFLSNKWHTTHKQASYHFVRKTDDWLLCKHTHTHNWLLDCSRTCRKLSKNTTNSAPQHLTQCLAFSKQKKTGFGSLRIFSFHQHQMASVSGACRPNNTSIHRSLSNR